ncbi:MAG: WYL domain-containing protein [Anaerolineaceae bacterium]|nr:WYL domain-containing protein [Anaerolineaceae bacterium]
MRADRLLSILMLLQSRGKMSASALSAELEVSKRTILRDIDALSASGVPVYSELGVNGGFSLLESYRSDLTGLTDEEVRVLFAFGIPTYLNELGVNQTLQSALRKLSASVSGSRGDLDVSWGQQRFYVDQSFSEAESSLRPLTSTITQGVWHDRMLRLTLRSNLYQMEIDLEAAPYAIVIRHGVWYLVARRRESYYVYSFPDIQQVELLDDTFQRDPAFDLLAVWQRWLAAGQLADYPARVRVKPSRMNELKHYLNAFRCEALGVREDGYHHFLIHFRTIWDARKELFPLGSALEILEPLPLRFSFADIAREIVNLYRDE